MKNNLSLFTLIGILLFSVSSIAQPYCSSSYPNYFQDYISNINFNTIGNPSGPTGYSDFTAQNTEVALGVQYNLTATIVNFNATTIYVMAWVDWNQDFDFNDPGESYSVGTVLGPTFGTNVSVNILVPAGATLGATTMRISAARGFIPTPCNSGGLLYGETEDYSVTIISTPVYWDGEADSDWGNPLNWSNDIVPTVTDPVIIPSSVAPYPNFTGALYVGANFGPNCCKTLIVETGASITVGGTGKISIFDIANINSGGAVSSNTLTVGSGGALYNNGGTISVNDECVFSLNSGGSMIGGSISVGGLLEFRSSTSWHSFGGTIFCKSGTNTEIINDAPGLALSNLVINTGGTAHLSGDSDEKISLLGSLTIQPNAEFTMDQPLTGGNISEIIIGQDLIVDGSIAGNASFISEDGTTFLTYGTTAVKNYYAEDRWHFISSPVTSAVSGIFLDLYLKAFEEPNNQYTPSPGITSTTYPLGVGQGFETFSDIGDVSVSYIGGQLNTDDISPSVTGTDSNPPAGIGDGEGWNLIGNPYPSAIDVGTENVPVPGYTWTNIDNTIYAWNGVNWSSFNRSGAGSGINGGTQIVPSMQGFFVKATTTTPSLIIPNSARLHSSQANYKSSNNANVNEIRLIVIGNGYSDEMIVRAIDNASNLFDSKYDAYKLPGLNEVPQLYSKAGSSSLSINSLPEFSEETIVPVFINVGKSGLYTIESNDFDLSEIDLTVYLEDLKEGSIIRLDENALYEFSSEINDEEYRFNLVFKNAKNDEINTSVVQIFSYDDIVHINKESGINSHIFVYDMMGREIIRITNNLDNELKLQVSAGTGNYVVKLVSDSYIETKKIFIR